MQIVVLPEVIEQKLKANERREVIDFINHLVADTSDGLKKKIIEILEEKFEKKLSVELVNLKLELMEKNSNLAEQLNERITKLDVQLSEKITIGNEKLRAELVEKIANSKVDMIKWMFIFWIGNVIAIIGGLFGILKMAKVF
jgi:hypothetical protein